MDNNRVKLWVAGSIVVIAILACGGSDTAQEEQPAPQQQDQSAVEEPAQEAQPAEQRQGQPAVEEPAQEAQQDEQQPELEGLVKQGTYLVGTDIEPGIYVGLASEGVIDSCYWARLSNLTGSDDILANNNAVGLFYVEVLPDDQALEVGCDLLPISQVPARDEFLTALSPGTYLVGRDIEAGTFRGQAGDDVLESCYWARLSNVSGADDILANNNATGQYFIEVLATDFALQVGCEVEQVEIPAQEAQPAEQQQDQSAKEEPAQEAQPASRQIIGEWLQNRPGLGPIKTTLYEEEGKVFIEEIYSDGSIGLIQAEEIPSSQGRKFIDPEANPAFGDYWLLDGQILYLGDNDGIFYTYEKP